MTRIESINNHVSQRVHTCPHCRRSDAFVRVERTTSHKPVHLAHGTESPANQINWTEPADFLYYHCASTWPHEGCGYTFKLDADHHIVPVAVAALQDPYQVLLDIHLSLALDDDDRDTVTYIRETMLQHGYTLPTDNNPSQHLPARQTLDAIHQLLYDSEWDADLMAEVGQLVLDAGYKIADPNDAPLEDKATCVLEFPTTATLIVQNGQVVGSTTLTPSAPGQWVLGPVTVTEHTSGVVDAELLDTIANTEWPNPHWEA